MNVVRAINISMELWGCVLILFVALCFLQERKPRTAKNRAFTMLSFCLAVLLLSDSLRLIFEGNPSSFHYNMVSVFTFIAFIAGYVVVACFTRYLTEHFRGSGVVSNWPLYINRTIVVIVVVLLCISQINHMFYYVNFEGYLMHGTFFGVLLFLGILGMAINVVFLLINRSRIESYEKLPLWICILLPLVMVFVQIQVEDMVLMNVAYAVSTLIIFFFVQIYYMRQRRANLAETRMNLMRSQIQPHFIFNTLGTIEGLCLVEPQKAADIIHEFAHYLRGNFDELESKTPIRLSREIEHVKHYTAIESVRFPDMEIYYNIRSSDFFLPALSVQPLVENAIKHGLMGLSKGGVVVISTNETDGEYFVRVKDNGVGFDVKTPLPDVGRKHLGIENVRERLWVMCKGTLTIESVPGKGTTAVIRIPKR